MVVYLLKSISKPSEQYVGLTKNLKIRLSEHNDGKSSHTARFRPWEIICAMWFKDKKKARDFEKFLKIGSGHAFAAKHFW